MTQHSFTDWKPPDKPVALPYAIKMIERPRFSLIAVIIDFFLPAALIAFGIWYLCRIAVIPEERAWIYYSFAFAGYGLLRLKQIVLWGILIYQRFASDKLRKACVFTPTCSEYMYQSICKYGLAAGLARGARRLLRCHEPNGGIDEP